MKVDPPITTYRSWISQRDKRLRVILNEEMVTGTLISCVITILFCAVLIPIELHNRSLQHHRESKMYRLITIYADLVAHRDENGN